MRYLHNKWKPNLYILVSNIAGNAEIKLLSLGQETRIIHFGFLPE